MSMERRFRGNVPRYNDFKETSKQTVRIPMSIEKTMEGRNIAIRVIGLIYDQYRDISDFLRVQHTNMGFESCTSAKRYIYSINSSGLYGLNPSRFLPSEKSRKRSMDKFSLLLAALNVPTDDDLIELTKDYDFLFQYPPRTSSS